MNKNQKARIEAFVDRIVGPNPSTFGPGGRFEVLDANPAQGFGSAELHDPQAKWPAPLRRSVYDRPAAFKAAAEILRAEGAPLDVVERTQSGERF